MRLPSPPLRMPQDVREWAVELVGAIQGLLDGLSRSYQRRGDAVELPSATVAELTADPAKFRPTLPSRMVYVIDDVGGPVVAFSDGTSWRRMTDGTVL